MVVVVVVFFLYAFGWEVKKSLMCVETSEAFKVKSLTEDSVKPTVSWRVRKQRQSSSTEWICVEFCVLCSLFVAEVSNGGFVLLGARWNNTHTPTHPHPICSRVMTVDCLWVISRESPWALQATLMSDYGQSCIRRRGNHLNSLNLLFVLHGWERSSISDEVPYWPFRYRCLPEWVFPSLLPRDRWLWPLDDL